MNPVIRGRPALTLLTTVGSPYPVAVRFGGAAFSAPTTLCSLMLRFLTPSPLTPGCLFRDFLPFGSRWGGPLSGTSGRD